MLHEQTTGGWTLLPLLGVLLLLSSLGQAEKKPIPSDLKIVAKYSPGYSDWVEWKYTITADGQVAQEIYDYGLHGAKSKVSRLTELELRGLLEKIKEADFFTLKKGYHEFYNPDLDTLVLSIALGGKNHEVVVDAPVFSKKNKEVRRFFRVWSEILRKVPSPNPRDKPELYQP
jgi:hypothetical protein